MLNINIPEWFGFHEQLKLELKILDILALLGGFISILGIHNLILGQFMLVVAITKIFESKLKLFACLFTGFFYLIGSGTTSVILYNVLLSRGLLEWLA